MGEETETKAPSDRDLRVSDEEREHVVSVLQKAIGRGLLDLDEFTERTDIALAARTRGELNAVLTDLPGLIHRDVLRQTVANPYVTGPQMFAPGQRIELNAKYSALHRTGAWLVPQAMLVRNKYGATKLDFSAAIIEFPVVHVELDIRWGSAEIIIPDSASVDLNQITEIKYGGIEDKTRPNGLAGNPRFVLSGRVHGGSLSVRNPRHGFFG
ncbi:DUF1707 domain-containing protein [Amycolatopsis sp. cg5]|uniref:DUF1707 SHOCT-like domain-containing protein n=1 Tax=Amycolatopsis sp. cg5 TaxID=3238802 RepID=UPI0035245FBB